MITLFHALFSVCLLRAPKRMIQIDNQAGQDIINEERQEHFCTKIQNLFTDRKGRYLTEKSFINYHQIQCAHQKKYVRHKRKMDVSMCHSVNHLADHANIQRYNKRDGYFCFCWAQEMLHTSSIAQSVITGYECGLQTVSAASAAYKT